MFSQIQTEEIVKSISEKGYCKIDDAIDHVFLDKLKLDLDKNRFHLNHNGVSGVYSENQYFFCHILAISKPFVELLTSNLVKSITKKIFQEKCRLKAIRYYETYSNHRMQWHTDNKTSEGFAVIPGIIFIIYIDDVNEGEFQYIEGSHKWTLENKFNDYSDDYIENNYKNKIKSFKGKKGAMMIYNSYGIHRAKPFKNRQILRKSLFFQIDQNIKNSEPILINPSFLTKENLKDEWVQSLMGFGENSSYVRYPNADIKNLQVKILLRSLKGYSVHRLKNFIFMSTPSLIKKILKSLGLKRF